MTANLESLRQHSNRSTVWSSARIRSLTPGCSVFPSYNLFAPWMSRTRASRSRAWPKHLKFVSLHGTPVSEDLVRQLRSRQIEVDVNDELSSEPLLKRIRFLEKVSAGKN